jgi:hypothetical protein
MSEATNQVIRCRQILKWCYVYGYYLIVKGNIAKNKEAMFIMNRDNLEGKCDDLNILIEKADYESFLDPENLDRSAFSHWKGKVNGLSDVLNKFFNNVVESLTE